MSAVLVCFLPFLLFFYLFSTYCFVGEGWGGSISHLYQHLTCSENSVVVSLQFFKMGKKVKKDEKPPPDDVVSLVVLADFKNEPLFENLETCIVAVF